MISPLLEPLRGSAGPAHAGSAPPRKEKDSKDGERLKDIAKDLRWVVREALKQGWEYKAGAAHGMVYSPDGETIICVPKKADPRGVRNKISDFRRAGVQLP